MTNEELKKKICDIIAPYVSAYGDDERIADALIAEGLTFEPMTFRIVENKPYSYTAAELANWKEDQDCIAKLLHRAEVAERALQKFAEYITCEDCPFFSDCASSEKMGYPIHSYHCFSEYLGEAERELAEEGKND